MAHILDKALCHRRLFKVVDGIDAINDGDIENMNAQQASLSRCCGPTKEKGNIRKE